MNDEKQLLTIGELAKTIGVTRRILLNYEDHGLIHPDEKEGLSGNRYYTVDTLARVKTIRILQNAGLSLAEILTYYEGGSDLTPMLRRLETVRDELTFSIEKIRERVNGGTGMEIQHTVLPKRTIYRRTYRTTSIAQKTIELRDVAYEAIQRYGTDLSRKMLAIEFSLDDPDEISYSIAIPPQSEGDCVVALPETPAIMVVYHGAYEELPSVRERLTAYAKEQSITLLGACWHIYLEGPPQHKDPQKFITQVVLPVADRRKNM